MAPKRYFEQSEAATEASTSEPAATAAAGPSKAAKAAASADAASRKATLFVSRLPFSATTTDLQTLFSDVGPLRRAFVVTDPATKISKGVGYVTFAVPEDAERALAELQGKKLDGKRAISITWADAKPAKGETVSAEDIAARKKQRLAAPRPAASSSSSSSTPHTPITKDANAVRTVILSGLSACKPAADSKTLYKRARKIGDVENVLYPFGGAAAHQQDPDVAHVIFRTPNHAATAVTKLHAHTFKGALLSAVLKKRADGAARLNARMRPEKKERMEKIRQEVAATSADASAVVPLPQLDSIPVAGVKHDSRLIIRNLPFDVDAADLRAVFLPYGPVYKIDVPQKVAAAKEVKEESVAPSEVKAEVVEHSDDDDDDEEEDESKDGSDSEDSDDDEEDSDSEEAAEAPAVEIKEEDEQTVKIPAAAPVKTPVEAPAPRNKGRGFAFVWLVSRADAARALEGVNGRAIRHGEAEKAAAKAAKGSKGRMAARQKLKEVRDNAQPERIVAVDWALGKSEWQKKEEEAAAEGTDAEGGDDEDEEEDGSSKPGDEDMDDDGDAASDASDEVTKPALPTPSEGTTLFVRNLPFEATEPELLTLFKQFGPVRYARITMDRSTDPPRSKGTGFVCFWNRDDAVEALRRAREVEEEAGTGRTVGGAASATGANAAAVQNPFSMTTSVLTADPSAPLTASFNLRGRILNVIPAVEREKADMLTAAGAKARQKQDKRNTYLMREGVPLLNTPLAAQLASDEREIERRLASFTQRKTQLAANPSLFISKTRLSVRQLPLFCTDRMLKRLAIYAIKAFKAEAKEGKRTDDLDTDELADRTFSPASKPPKKGERSTSVIQSKVVKALDRPDPITGAPGGRSKGFGFLEMRSFQEALRVLRWANANRDVGKLMAQWHVEELEDLKKKIEGDIAKGSSPDGVSAADLSTRLKRVVARLDDFKTAGAKAIDKAERGGLLFVEFSIENATVVKQRRDRAEQNRKNAERRKAREEGGEGVDDDEEEEVEEEEEEQEEGRRAPRRANWNQSTKKSKGGAAADDKQLRRAKEQASDKVSRSKEGSSVGGMIGRKRAEKRRGKK